MAEEKFKKIEIDRCVYFLHCKKQTDGFAIQLVDGLDVFQGSVSKNDINEMAVKLNIELPKFEILFTDCFCESSDVTQFIYDLQNESTDHSKLVWKQVLEGGMKYQLGSLLLKKLTDPAAKMLSMFDILTRKVENLSNNVEELQRTNDKLHRDQEEMTKRMQKYAGVKETLENELYAKFASVLNTKKARIRELKIKIDEGPSKKDDRSNNSDQLDTDEEEEVYTRKRNADKTSPITTECAKDVESNAIVDGESILLDDSIEDDEDIPRKSRKKIRAASKLKTPVNSVMPRTTSLPRPKRQQNSSERKSTRRQVSKEMNESDLLDEL